MSAGGKWPLFAMMLQFYFALPAWAYKRPSFCDQDGDPFSFLWMIKRDPPSYLFGTIHVPYTKVWDHIPDNAKQAFAASSQVFFELDLADPATVAALSTCQMLPQGKNLSDVLPQDLYSRLKRHLEYVRGMMPRWMTQDQGRGRGIFKGLFNADQRGLFNADYLFNAIAGNWERKRPVWVMLMVNSLTESDVRSRGVPVLDLYLAQEAERMRKKTAAVEKVEEQCLPLNGLNFSQVLFALNHTLLQHEELRREAELQQQPHPPAPYTTDDLIRHYNCGDMLSGSAAFLGADSVPPLPPAPKEEAALARNLDRYLRRELILNRNRRMGERVARLLGRHPGESLFFAFGAGHFLGNNTVLDFVQAHGYEVEHLSVTTKIPKSKTKKSVRSETSVKTSAPSTPFPPRKNGSQSRRSSRHRLANSSPVFPRSGSPVMIRRTTMPPIVTTQRSRRFNDLWVRLDTYGRKKSNPAENDPKADLSGPQQAFQTWYEKSQGPDNIHSSGSILLPTDGSSLTLTTLLIVFRCLLPFLQNYSLVALTGIT